MTYMGFDSREALADKAGVSRPTVTKVIQADPSATIKKWRQIAHRGFGFAPDTFECVSQGDWRALRSRNVPDELVTQLRRLLEGVTPAGDAHDPEAV